MDEIILPELAQPVAPAPWERLDGEDDKYYARFLVYLRDRRMTLKEAAEEIGQTYETIRRLAQKYRWRARREAYYVEEDIEMRRAMKDRVVAHSSALVSGWNSIVEVALDSIAKRTAEGKDFNLKDAASALKAATDALRLLHGQPSQHVELNLKGAPKEKLTALEKILAELDTED